jgi:hypothetical protein
MIKEGAAMTRSYEIRGIMLVEDGALTCPRLVCDACQQIIEQASAANVNWDIEAKTAVVIHKQCDVARGAKEDMSMPLEVELLWLLGNSGLRGKELTKAKQSAKWMDSLSRRM